MAFTEEEALRMHPLYEEWMDKWVFVTKSHYLGYTPDNTIITRQSIKKSNLKFLQNYLAAVDQWQSQEANHQRHIKRDK